jgi:hydroxyacylglutathione hydrolase
MLIKTVVVGPLGTNCYIVADKPGSAAFVIDPGEDALDIMDALDEDDLTIEKILITHGHFDHIQAAGDLKKARGGDILAHPADGFPGADGDIAEGDVLAIDGVKLTVMETPGHSLGSCSFMGDRMLFCGDLLFQGSVGRTDFEGGSMDELMNSLARLKKLPNETIVYPGHGPRTTIGAEKESNPFLLMGRS